MNINELVSESLLLEISPAIPQALIWGAGSGLAHHLTNKPSSKLSTKKKRLL